MIRYTTGNLLVSGADALVNAVNTVGVSGKRIALTFRQAYPANFKAYEAAAKAGRVVVGEMFVPPGRRYRGRRPARLTAEPKYCKLSLSSAVFPIVYLQSQPADA
jgi:O-acetyl-ADP-ribose deacetylase (regulator of RNase III)